MVNFIFNEFLNSKVHFQVFESSVNLQNIFLSEVDISSLPNVHIIDHNQDENIRAFLKVNIACIWDFDPTIHDPKSYRDSDFSLKSFYLPFTIRKKNNFFIIGVHHLFFQGNPIEIRGDKVYIHEVLLNFSSFFSEVMSIIAKELKISPCMPANFTQAIKELVRIENIKAAAVACDDKSNYGKNMRKLHRGAPKGFVDFNWYEEHDFFQTDKIYKTNWYWTKGYPVSGVPRKYPSLKIDCNSGEIIKEKKTSEGFDWFIDEIIRNS